MIVLLVTSKTMDFDKIDVSASNESFPIFNNKINELASYFNHLSLDEIKEIMKVSDKLAHETKQKFNQFSFGKNKDLLKQAVFTFTGEVYKGLSPKEFSRDDLLFCNKHLRIISGLYGILSPLDLIEPYRLEMGYRVDINQFNKVSNFWKESVTDHLNSLIKEKNSDLIIDLASKEYTNAIDEKKLNTKLTKIVFKENKGGKLKTIAIYSKKARGKMANHIIKNRINDKEKLKKFNEDGYKFVDELSCDNKLVFIR